MVVRAQSQAGLSGHSSLGTWQRIELARRWGAEACRS